VRLPWKYATWALVLVFLTLAVSVRDGAASPAKPAPGGLDSWRPDLALGGSWVAESTVHNEPLVVDDVRACQGDSRAWRNADSADMVTLSWYSCTSSDLSAVTTRLAHIHQEDPVEWRSVSSALGAGTDMTRGTPAGHERVWIQNTFVVLVEVSCETLSATACFARSAVAARDIAGRLPDRPKRITIDTTWLVLPWALAGVIWAAVLIGVRVRRVNSTSNARVYGVPMSSTPLDRQARRLYWRSLWRRIGIGMVTPLGLLAFGWTGQVTTDNVDLRNDLSSLFCFSVIAVPGAALILATRHPLLSRNWLWTYRQVQLSRRRRLCVALVRILAAALVFAGLTVLIVPVGSPWELVGLSPPIRLALLIAPFAAFGGASATSILARHLKRRGVWQALDGDPSRTFMHLRTDSEPWGSLPPTALTRRGFFEAFSQLLVPWPADASEPLLLTLLARYGHLVSVRSGSRPVSGSEPTVVALPSPEWRSALAERVRRARAVVINGLPGEITPYYRETLRLVADPAHGRVVLIFPPVTQAERNKGLANFNVMAEGLPLFAPLIRGGASPPPSLLLLVHIPGRGWASWLARRRTSWAYAEATDQMMQLAVREWDVPQASSEETLEKALIGSAPPEPVAVLATMADQTVARDVADGLNSLGQPAVVVPVGQPPSGYNAVVLLSPTAVRDPDWRAALAQFQHVRIIPVKCADLTTADVESLRSVHPILASLNWVDWKGRGRVAALADLFTAVNSESSRYRVHGDLLVQAQTWASGGRRPELLLADRQRVRAAQAHLANTARDTLARPTPLMREYVQASARATTARSTMVLRWSAAFTAVAVLAGVLAVGAVYIGRTRALDNQLNGLVSTVPVLSADQAPWLGVLAGAAILGGGATEAQLGRQELRWALGQPWPRTFLGGMHDAEIFDAASVDGTQVLTVDLKGTLTAWATDTGAVAWRRQLGTSLDLVAVAPDRRGAVATDGNVLHLVRFTPWNHATVSLSCPATHVAVAPASDTAIVACENGQLLSVGLAAPHRIRRVGTFTHLYDLRTLADGTVRVLGSAEPDAVEAVDGESGRALGRVAIEQPELGAAAALSADGQTLAVVDKDHRLRFGSFRAGLAVGGLHMPDEIADLVVLPDGRVVSATPQFGVRIYDTTTGLVTARIRQSQPNATRLRISTDGRWIMCLDGLGVYLWDLDGLMPARPPTSNRHSEQAPTPGATTVKVVATTPTGSVSVHLASGLSATVPAVTGRVTVTDVKPDGVAALVGSDRGEVAEIDLRTQDVVARWQAPDGSAITAATWSERPGWLIVHTAADNWWSPWSCDGCGLDATIIDVLKHRLWSCYLENNVAKLSAAVRRQLGIRLCQPSPAATSG